MLIVGSQALVDWRIRLGRKPRDLDIIATPDEYGLYYDQNKENVRDVVTDGKPNKRILFMRDKRIVEFELATETNPTGTWLLENYSSLGYPSKFRNFSERSDPDKLVKVAHPDVVLTLKTSHRYLKNSPHFRKTMDDILALRGLKYRVPPLLQKWLKDREKATYDYGHPSLKRDKGKFFSGDGVNYKYEHDDIHEALATLKPSLGNISAEESPLPARPAYIQFQKDPRLDVSVSKEKWLRCSEAVKLNSVLEESYVLALERSQIPCDFSIAPWTSFLIALEKVCTSITSGWWREYAWEHYFQVLGMYSDNYVDRFQKALSEGKIRPYQGQNHD